MDLVLHKLMLLINGLNENSTYYNLAVEMIKNIDQLQNLTIYEIAELCFVSTSTLSRFCRLLGYKNFNQFKEALQESYGFEIDYDSRYLHSKENLKESLDYMNKMTLTSLKEVYEQIDLDQLIQLAAMVHDQEEIYIFGSTTYQFLTMYLQERLGLFKKIIHVHPDLHQQPKMAATLTDKHLAIMLSPRGSSHVQSRIVPTLYKHNVKMVLITQNEHSVYKERYELYINLHGSYDNNLGMITLMRFLDMFIQIYYALYHEELIV